MGIRAGIDIGTNTILMLVAEENAGSISILEDHMTIVRLGEGVDKNRNFSEPAMSRASACFKEYKKILEKYPSVVVKAVATSGSRDAKNSQNFFKEIEKIYGFSIRVIEGEEEARYAYLGSRRPDLSESQVILDIGGGSSELVGFVEGVLERFSFDLGCVRVTEKFFSDPIQDDEFVLAQKYIQEQLLNQKKFFDKFRSPPLVGVAGTATYVASSILGLVRFDAQKINGQKISLKEVEGFIEKMKKLKAKERLGFGGMDEGRADVIVGGALVLREIMKVLGVDHYHASTLGLRYGLVYEN
ncbi:MAG: Ppx/GppA family phosphatase [Oligoflexia bacterium]|nr:Ppx/GppA family phosphatase [Oligoflexia bacterium]